MQATINEQASNARNYGGEKETVTTMRVVARVNGKLATPVEARFYMGRSRTASTVYCALWVHGANVYTSGSGQAGGGGYHKESAALQSAITSAGIELHGSNYALSEGDAEDLTKRAHIGGCGSESMRAALLAIAKAAGADCSEYLID